MRFTVRSKPDPSRDPESFVRELHFDAENAAEGLDILPQRVDLGSLDIAVLDSGHAILADLQALREVHLREIRGLAQVSQALRSDFLEQLALHGIHTLAIKRPFTQQVFH